MPAVYYGKRCFVGRHPDDDVQVKIHPFLSWFLEWFLVLFESIILMLKRGVSLQIQNIWAW